MKIIPDKMTFREKMAFACGDFGNAFGLLFLSAYLMLFLTDVLGLSAATAGLISAGVVVFDALNDPIIGWLIDRLCRKGDTYRKIVGWCAIPYAAAVFLLFLNVPFSAAGKAAWVAVVYCLWSVFATTYNTAYGSLSTVVTDDSEDRTKLGAFRDWGSNCGGLIINFSAMSLILYFGGGNMNQRGFAATAAIVAVVMVVGILISSLGTRTRVSITHEKVNYLDAIKAIFRTKSAIAILLIYCLANINLLLKSSLGGYYAINYLGNEMMFTVILVLICAIPLVGVLFIPALTKKFGRKAMFLLGGACTILSGVVSLVGGTNIVSVILSAGLSGLTMCFTTTVIWGALPDTTDFIAAKYGIFVPGVLFSTLTFCLKLAQAGCNYLVGWLLDVIGYDGLAEIQTASCTQGIARWFGLLPIIVGVLLAGSALIYSLPGKSEKAAIVPSVEEL